MVNSLNMSALENHWGAAVPSASPTAQSIEVMIRDIASTDVSVLLVGESGTGKDIYAHQIHRLSGERPGRWKKIVCATAEAKHLQTELQDFCHAQANLTGTPQVFFDGVEELDQPCQKILLAFLPDGEIRGEESKLRARVICSATRHPEKEVASGKFRRELYFRINGVCLQLPPLRERKEDVASLMNYFLKKHAEELKKKIPELQPETLDALREYQWPGNIRELENIARKIVLTGNPESAVSDLSRMPAAERETIHFEPLASLKLESRAASRQRERELILQALQRTKWNRKRAARELQISYKSLLYKIKQIETPGFAK